MGPTTVKRIIGSAFVVLIITFLIAGFQFYGVISAGLGELCFTAAWLIGTLWLIFSGWLWDREVSTKVFVGVIGSIIWGVCLLYVNGWAEGHRQVTRPTQTQKQPGLPQYLPNPPRPSHSPQAHNSENLNQNDIKVAVCQTNLRLIGVVPASYKFDGPEKCRIRIYSDSQKPLRNAVLRIYLIPTWVKIQTEPEAEKLPTEGGSMDDYFYQMPLSQTLARGEEFTARVMLPHRLVRYEIQLKIIDDNGQELGPWSIVIIPVHETES